MKALIISSVFLILPVLSFSQTQDKPIEIRKNFFTSYRYYQNDQRLRFNALAPIMKSNPEAYKTITKARNTMYWALGTGGAALLTGYLGIHRMLTTPNNIGIMNLESGIDKMLIVYMGLALGFEIAAVTLFTIHTLQTKKAVTIYNEGLHSTTRHHMYLNLGITQNGIGLQLKF
ncbi:MAG: hypothetical protein ABFS32_03695 [Bacteroidota bacterium]